MTDKTIVNSANVLPNALNTSPNVPYKSFAYKFQPLEGVRLTAGKYENIDALVSSDRSFWMHFEKPSKNLQQQLGKKFNIPKPVRMILFAEDSRPRCVKFDDCYVLVVQGIQPSAIRYQEDIPMLSFWITPKGILSIASGKLQAVLDVQVDIQTATDPTPMSCLAMLLEYVSSYIEEATYQLDEELDKIESNREVTEQAITSIMNIRQDIVRFRRYVLPQRDAIVSLTNRIEAVTTNDISVFKELSNNMVRQAELLETLRERAIIVQDNLTNQIGEVSNKRMYLLTIIMLIFTPSFFIMSLFSMYIPIPGMNSKATWWILLSVMIVISASLMWVFRRKKWV